MEQELPSLDVQQITHSFTCFSPAARAVNFCQLTLSWLTWVECMYYVLFVVDYTSVWSWL